jgi:glycolate oxidase
VGSGRQAALRAALRIGRTIGESRVLTDADVIERYGADESEQPPRVPDAVILPRDATEAARALAIAAERSVAVTPRAGGTGKSGGAVPVEGGLVMGCDRLDRIKEIDPVDLVAVVEPGVVLERLHDAVEELGLFYPPDPASLDACCLGGNVAENAGGPRAFKYGVTGHYVLGLQVVTGGGDAMRVGRRPVKGVAGYPLEQLFVGSEGTLGFFTEITLRLLPRPRAVRTLLATFDGSCAACGAVVALLGAGVWPRVLEFLDGECVRTVRDAGAPVPAAGAMLLVELDGLERGVEEQMEHAGNTLDAAGAGEVLVAEGPRQTASLWRARRDLSEDLGRRATFKISDDISVPRSRLVSTLEGIDAAALRYGMTAATFGHAGDGNLHVNLLWNDPDLDPRPAHRSVLDLAIAAGGTISGEHGIGSVKRGELSRELSGQALELSRGLKRLLDPAAVLNPGKVLP